MIGSYVAIVTINLAWTTIYTTEGKVNETSVLKLQTNSYVSFMTVIRRFVSMTNFSIVNLSEAVASYNYVIQMSYSVTSACSSLYI